MRMGIASTRFVVPRKAGLPTAHAEGDYSGEKAVSEELGRMGDELRVAGVVHAWRSLQI